MIKNVTISVDLLQRLVDAAYDFHPANKAADEGQDILNKLEDHTFNFNDEFLKEVIEGERSRNIHVVQKWCADNGFELVAKREHP